MISIALKKKPKKPIKLSPDGFKIEKYLFN